MGVKEGEEAPPPGRCERFLVDPYVDSVVKYPHAWCGSCCCFIFFLSVLSIATGALVPKEEDEAWMVIDGESTQTYKAWRNAEWQALGRPPDDYRRLAGDDYRRLADGPPSDLPDGGFANESFGGVDWWSLAIFYKSDESESGNIFTPKRLQEMCRLEALVISAPSTWALNDSPTRLFYQGQADADSCPELAQSVVSSRLQVMLADVTASGTGSKYARFVHPSFATTGSSAYSRAVLQVTGGPGSDEAAHRKEVMMDYFLKDLGLSTGFLKSALTAEDDRFVPSGPLRVRVSFDNNEEILVWIDFSLSFIAIVIVYWLLYVYLNSAFLAAASMYQIIFSLPVAALFYRWLFMISYFDKVHILVIYLVLGIGADDVFVLIDTFRHFASTIELKAGCRYDDAQLADILKRTVTRSGQAIFNTSFTTTVAFLSQSGSGIMPMRTCGWFAALAIIANFVMTMLFTPSALIVFHRRLQSKRCCCPSWVTRPADSGGQAEGGSEDNQEVKQQSTANGLSKCVEAFLDKFYIPAMRKQVGPVRITALVVTVVMLAVAIQGAYYTSLLTPPMKPEVWVPDTHMQRDITKFWSENFYEADYEKSAVVSFTWGISGADTSDFDSYRPTKTPPQAQFDPAFDVSTAEAQAEILDVCAKMQTMQCQVDGCTGPGSTLMFSSSKKAYSCFLEDMKQWRVDHLGRPQSEALPVGAAFIAELKQFVASNPWDEKYSSEVCRAEYDHDVGFVDGELKYVSVKVRTRMNEEEPYGSGLEVRDLIRSFVDGRKAGAPAGLKSMNFHANGLFTGYDLSAELINGLFSGISIAFPLAFVVLLISTRNFVVSLYAVCCVGGIVVSVLGFCKTVMDWDLGIGEALAGVIVIGYSVDYVVHLSHIYCEASHYGHNTRDARATFAIQNMGSTIFAGALTTASSGCIMFACFFQFFYKMAVLISVTIMYSFLFSMGLFMGMLWLIGPEGTCGDIGSIFKGRGLTPEAKVAAVAPEPAAPDPETTVS